MNKLSRLLDGTTLLNIPEIFKLCLRYKNFSIGIISACLLIGIILLFTQKEIYWLHLNFTKLQSKDNTKGNAFSQAFFSSGKNKQVDILNLRRSIVFTKLIAHKLIESKKYKTLHFQRGGVFSKSTPIGEILGEKCQSDYSCLNNSLTKIIPSSYKIRDIDRKGKNFVLEVNGMTNDTTVILLMSIRESISEYIVKLISGQLIRDKEQTEQLLKEKQIEISKKNVQVTLEEKEFIENLIEQNNNKIKDSNKIILESEVKLDHVKAQFNQTQNTLKKKVNYNDVSKDKKIKALKEKISQLTSDINALETANSTLEQSDKQIIVKLNNKLASAKIQLKELGNESRFSIDSDLFLKQKDKGLDFGQFDYQVLTKQIEATKKKHELLNNKKSILLKKKMKILKKYDRIAPLINLVKELEKKQVKLSMQINTVSDSLEFDQTPAKAIKTKKIGRFLGVTYLIFITLIILILAVIIKFLLDKTFYNEEQLEDLFGKDKVLGVSPKYFDS